MLLLMGDAFWCLDPIQLWIWMARISHLIMDDLMLPDFPTYHISNAIRGHISLSVEIYRSLWSRMILITYKMHVELMVYCYFVMISQ